jgi:hypothetical protein
MPTNFIKRDKELTYYPFFLISYSSTSSLSWKLVYPIQLKKGIYNLWVTSIS